MKRVRLFCVSTLMMSLLLIPLISFSQNITVRGTVNDKAGAPIQGVGVVVEGTSVGAVTDAKGDYSINVRSSGVLDFSFVGFVSQKVEVNGRNRINITLEEDSQIIDEVVVIGYGTARRSDVTGSIASIDAKAIKEIPSANVMQALQGRLAGVDMSQQSSRPGSEMQIRIRGTRSLTASNDPLIVLDGIPFPGNISDINPDDIKSIDILKDASSTAIYGARGANGVMLITSNKGASLKPTVTYSGYYGINTIFSRYPMMSGEQFTALRTEAKKNGSPYGPGVNDDPNVNTDWQDLVLKNGFSTNHNVSISAPTQGGSYNFSLGYYKDEGVAPLQGYQRYSVRGGFDQKIGKILRVGITTTNSLATTTGEKTSVMEKLLAVNPTINPYNADGSVRQEYMALNSSDYYWNPAMYNLPNNNQKVDEKNAFASYSTMFAEVNIWGGIKYRFNLGGNYRQTVTGEFTGTEGPWNGGTTKGISSANTSNSHSFNWVAENLLTWDWSRGKHTVNAVAMYSAEQTKYWKSKMSATNITINEVQFYNIGLNTGNVTVNPSDQDYSLRGLISYMGRVAYGYDNRYMLTATIRSDGSSVLAPGNKWHTYPAVSAGWNIANEQFMKKTYNVIDMLKLRVGYGQTSNQSINPYQTYGMMSQSLYNYGSNPATGYFPNTVPNKNLGWEYSETYNFGLDFGLFKGRLTGSAEYYIQKTKDLLMSLTLPSSSGINGKYMTNIGATENKGFELTLNGLIISNKDWSWSAGVNVYTNNNKITKLAAEQDRDVANMWFVGHSINSIYDYKKIGIWQLGEEEAAKASLAGMVPGNIKVDYNTNPKFGDPVTFNNGIPSRAINANDRFILGSTDADFQGGFNTNVSYKNFDFGIVGTFRSGGILISTLHAPQGYLNMLNGRRNNIDVDYWTVDNPTNKYPRAANHGAGQDAAMYGTTLSYFDASYVKLRSITVGYNFKGEWMKKLGMSSGRAYFTCQNPFVIYSPYTRETGLDPETNAPVNSSDVGNVTVRNDAMPTRLLSVGYNTPALRSFVFGLNLTF